MPTDPTDTVPLFGRAVPAPAFKLLLRLEDEGYEIRVDPATRELCLAPRVLPSYAQPSRDTSTTWSSWSSRCCCWLHRMMRSLQGIQDQQDQQDLQDLQDLHVRAHAHIGLGLSGLVGTCRDFGQGAISRQRQ